MATNMRRPIPRRASRTVDYASPSSTPSSLPIEYIEDEENQQDDIYPRRGHSTAIRYITPNGDRVIEQGNRRIVIHQGKPRRRIPWLSLIGIGMIAALLLVWLFSAIGSWWQEHQLEVTYGYPRTFQTDAVVYPGDSTIHPSHYIFLNLNGTVEIIELPHGDSAKAKIYRGPTIFADNPDQVPVTGEFRDVNGKVEMLVHIQTQTIIYINDGTQFKPQQ